MNKTKWGKKNKDKDLPFCHENTCIDLLIHNLSENYLLNRSMFLYLIVNRKQL